MSAAESSGWITHVGTVHETAKLFGIPDYLIRDLVKQRKIAFLRAGNKKVYVNQDSLAEYLMRANTPSDTTADGTELAFDEIE